MYSYSYSNLDKLIWLDETLKKGSPFEPSSKTNEHSLRPYQCWKKARYEEALSKSDQIHQTFEKSSLEMTHKLDDMIEFPNLLLKKTNKEDLEYEMVIVKIPRCMSWLGSTSAYNEHIGSLGMMDNKVGNTSQKSTPQILPSFEEYTPPVTYREEVKKTLETLMEVEPLDQTKLEDVCFDACNHDIPLSYREVPGFNEPEPQPQTLLNCPSLDVSLGDKRGREPPIKPYSLDSFCWESTNDNQR
nr:hypothetical protein [Tanacetum cinerariifolium]